MTVKSLITFPITAILILPVLASGAAVQISTYPLPAPNSITADVDKDRATAELSFPDGATTSALCEVVLEGLESSAPAYMRRDNDKIVCTQQAGQQTTITRTFSSHAGALRVEVDVHSADSPWTTPVLFRMKLQNPNQVKLWTARGGPKEWTDPLQPYSLITEKTNYGAWFKGPALGFALPMVAVFPQNGQAFSIAVSPDEPLLEMSLNTYSTGTLELRHKFHRLGGGRHARFVFEIARHEPDVRAALGWFVARFPDYFEPPNPRAHTIAGGGAYSGYEGALDVEKLHRMSYRTNWKASLDFPYMGMFLPPVQPEVEYNRFAGGGKGTYVAADEGRFGKTSISALERYNVRMKKDGFYVLSYFNVTEFGGNILSEAPPTPTSSPLEFWKDPNVFLYQNFPNAILRMPNIQKTWGGAVATDCGDSSYSEFLLTQARRHVDELPSSDGICIDRMDWLTKRNPNADDGITWDNGPQRSLYISWRDFMEKLGPLMHNARKVIFANTLIRRLETIRHVDGVYDEYGHDPRNLNTASFLALHKPLICWTPDEKTIKTDTDAFFQRHLHMGAFMTIPVPGNDHTILPSEWADKQYLDYGPLFNALQGRKWILQAGVVTVTDERAKANLFEVPGGWVAPVTFAQAPEVELVLRGLPKNVTAKALSPGKAEWITLPTNNVGNETRIRVPVERACAMIRITP